MDHEGPVLLSILGDEAEIEPLRQVEVELDGCALPLSANGVLYLNVDLRSVESPTAFIQLIAEAHLVESRAQCLRRPVPVLRLADVLFRPVRQKDLGTR